MNTLKNKVSDAVTVFKYVSYTHTIAATGYLGYRISQAPWHAIFGFYRLILNLIVSISKNIDNYVNPKPVLTWQDEVWLRLNLLFDDWKHLLTFSNVSVSLGVIVALVILRMLRKSLKEMVMTFRGVYIGEAMRVGSAFTKGEIPPGQIQVMLAGMLMDTHLGFGLRVGDLLVVPTHVIGHTASPILAYKAKDGKRKVQVDLNGAFVSRIMPDVTYIPLSLKVWTRLGAPKVSIVKALNNRAAMVDCTGVDGQKSIGLLRPSTTVGLMNYGGSTIPGMSGAGYFVSNKCYGMHTGVIGNNNVGVSSVVLAVELEKVIRGESSMDFGEQEFHKAAPVISDAKFKAWDEIQLRQKASKAWDDDEENFDYDQKLDWLNDEESARPNLAKKFSLNRDVILTTQSPTGDQVVYQQTTIPNAELAKLHDRVTTLEKILDCFQMQTCEECSGIFNVSITDHMKIHSQFPCTTCSVVCRTKESLKQHIANSHNPRFTCDRCGVACRNESKLTNHRKECKVPTAKYDGNNVTLESAMAIDNQPVPVKEKSFLEATSLSKKKRSKKLKPSSSSKGATNPSPSLEEILLRMSQSLERLEKR